jgi:hypothetical protein
MNQTMRHYRRHGASEEEVLIAAIYIYIKDRDKFGK